MLKYIIIFLISFIGLKVFEKIKMRSNNQFATYFAPPGGGKSTIAAYLAKKYLKKGLNVYSNVPIKGCYKISKSDIGKYDMSYGLIILDEASTEFLARNFKNNFNDEQVKFFKMHRHYRVDILCFSQSWSDIDIILRNLSTRLYLLKKSIFPFFITRRTIGKKIGINKDTHLIEDQYYWIPFSRKRIFAPSVWHMFNTHDRDSLPIKKFDIYE